MDPLAVVGWPVLDRIPLGPFALSPHGLGIAAGFLAGAMLMLRREGPRRGMDEDHIGTILFAALIGAIVGARVFYVIGHFDEFQGFTDMLAIWRGGISLLGGIAGAIIFAYPFMRRFGYRFGQVMDSAAVGLALGIIIGRIGDLVIGDHLGKPTDFFLGWSYAGGNLPGPWVETSTGEWVARLPDGTTQVITEEGAQRLGPGGEVLQQGAGVHQTALYDLFIAAALFGFLWWLSRRPRREGVLIASFAVWYGAGRIFTDFLRVDKTWVIGLTGSQWASVGAILVAGGTLVWFALRPRREPGGPAVPLPADDRPTTAFTPPAMPGERARTAGGREADDRAGDAGGGAEGPSTPGPSG